MNKFFKYIIPFVIFGASKLQAQDNLVSSRMLKEVAEAKVLSTAYNINNSYSTALSSRQSYLPSITAYPEGLLLMPSVTAYKNNFQAGSGFDLGLYGVTPYPYAPKKNRLVRILIAPSILMGLGLFTNKNDGFLNKQDFRFVWISLAPDFEDDFDDYAQYVPYALTYALKLSGVKGRNRIDRATVSLAIGATISGVTVAIMKAAISEERPDMSKDNSFPSGHTTTAFVGATFLHKEYGLYSPFYSILGYSLAGLTGMFRQLNDRHWISDVLFGAGMGILGVELGYWITDEWIYKTKGLNPLPEKSFFDKAHIKPSFVAYKLGYAQWIGDIDEIQADGFNINSGFSFGVEGAWFFTPWIGIGGEYTIASFPVTIGDFVLDDPEIEQFSDGLESTAFGRSSLFFGPYVNINITDKIGVMAKFTGGFAEGSPGGIFIKVQEEFQEQLGASLIPVLAFEPQETAGFATGLYFRAQISQVIALGVYGEYQYANPFVDVFEVTDIEPDGELVLDFLDTGKVRSDYVAFGVTVHAMLWGGKYKE